MRKIKDLITNQDRVWLYFATTELSQTFVSQVTAEGFHISPSLASERNYVLAIHKDLTVSYVPLHCWTRAFQKNTQGVPVCVDYGKYLSGEEDYLCHESHFQSQIRVGAF